MRAVLRAGVGDGLGVEVRLGQSRGQDMVPGPAIGLSPCTPLAPVPACVSWNWGPEVSKLCLRRGCSGGLQV